MWKILNALPHYTQLHTCLQCSRPRDNLRRQNRKCTCIAHRVLRPFEYSWSMAVENPRKCTSLRCLVECQDQLCTINEYERASAPPRLITHVAYNYVCPSNEEMFQGPGPIRAGLQSVWMRRAAPQTLGQHLRKVVFTQRKPLGGHHWKSSSNITLSGSTTALNNDPANYSPNRNS